MIAVDTNILVYAHREEQPQHPKAKQLILELAEGNRPWGIPVFCIGEFLRIITHVKIWNPPFNSKEATEALSRILASPSVKVLMPGTLYMSQLLQVITTSNASGNLLFDAQIAALCLEHGVTYLITEDRDFARFSSLKTKTLDLA